MKLHHLRNVLAVAERGSLRSAARHLDVAQPAITRSIRELEHELGASLFERHATGVILTAVGEAFVKRASAIEAEFQRLKDEAGQLSGLPTGSLTVSLSIAAHMGLLPKALPPFSRRYPNVMLKLIEGLFPAVEADIHNGLIDFYVGPLSEEAATGELEVESLLQNTRVIVGRKGHPLASAKTLADLTEATWITTAVTVRTAGELEPLFLNRGLPSPKVVMQANSGLTLFMTVAYSDHLAMLPRQWLDHAPTAQLLEPIQLDTEIAAPTIFLVRRSRLPLTPVAEHLADLFRRAAGYAREAG